MCANRVALFGHNSSLGRIVTRNLLTHHKNTTLSIYHRSGSKVDDVPANVDKIQIDYGDETGLARSLKGVDVIVSTVGNTGIPSNVIIGRAAKAAGVKAFIPAYYTTHPIRTEDERQEQEAHGAPHIAAISRMRDELESLGVPLCLVVNGMFAYPAMAFGFVLPSVVRSAAEFYGDAATIPHPVSSQEYLGAGIAEIASSPPSSIIGRTIALIECYATGQEMIEAVESVTGKPVAVSRLTDEMVVERTKNVDPPPAITFAASDAYLKKLWGEGRVMKSDDAWEVKTVPKQSLLDLVKFVKKMSP